MAVKKSKMIERYKHCFPSVNLSKERLNTLMVKLSKKLDDDASDDDIDEVLTDFNEIYSFKEIMKDDDRKRKAESDKKKKEEEAAAKKKAGETEDDDDDEEDDLGDDVPEYVKKLMKQNKAVLKQNATLQQKVDDISSGRDTDNKRSQARKLFDSNETFKGIEDQETKDFWFKQLDLTSETPFDEQIESLEAQHSKMFQGKRDAEDYAGPAGGGGKKPHEVDQEKVDNVLDNMNI